MWSCARRETVDGINGEREHKLIGVVIIRSHIQHQLDTNFQGLGGGFSRGIGANRDASPEAQ